MTHRLRLALSLAAILLAAFLPHTAHAAMPSEDAQPIAHYCDDTAELAGVINAEMGAQPFAVQLRGMQILVNEAASRQISVCVLSALTNFSTVRAYVRLHPDSYQARQLAYPPEDLLQMAGDVLTGKYPDVTEGARHFDGSPDGMRVVFRP